MAFAAIHTANPLWGTLSSLDMAVMRVLWKFQKARRCPMIVRNLLCPAHRVDPTSYIQYQRLVAMHTVRHRCPDLWQLVTEIRSLRTPRGVHGGRAGPVR